MVYWEPTPSTDECIGAHARHTYCEVDSAGPPARPLEFPAPEVHRGARVTVNVYDRRSGEIHSVKNVLVRVPDWTQAVSRPPDRAYCIRKKLGDSVYGSVRVCVVMKRCNVVREEIRPACDPCAWDFGPDGHEEGDCDDGSGGQGGGDVWEATDELVVVKLAAWAKVRNMRGRHLEDPIKEVAAMQLVGDYHPNVIGSLEVFQDDKYLYSVMPYCPNGDLYGKTMENFRASDSGRLSESQARRWFRQILMGLHHLQQKGVCHRDLSLENILVDKNNNLKIIDLGMCLRVPYSDPDNHGCLSDVSAGTPRRLMCAQGQGGKWMYMAPEVVAREDVFDGFAIDLWAAGVILYMMLVGLAPFKWAHESDKRFVKFTEGHLKKMMEHWKIPISDEAADLLQNMFWREPSKRLTLAEVMEHPWVVNGEKPVCVPQPEKKKSPFRPVLVCGSMRLSF